MDIQTKYLCLGYVLCTSGCIKGWGIGWYNAWDNEQPGFVHQFDQQVLSKTVNQFRMVEIFGGCVAPTYLFLEGALPSANQLQNPFSFHYTSNFFAGGLTVVRFPL